MINDVDSVDWASLGHAYGPADEVPGWLRGMVSPDSDVRKEAFSNFYGKVLHQGSMYSSTVASVPFLFAMADDPATPDRAEVVALLLSIGREAVDAEEIYAVVGGEDGEEFTFYPDTANLMREHADAFVAYATDFDLRVRQAAIEGLGLFLDDAERAVALLNNRLVEESGVTERLLVVRTMADLALRLPAGAAPARAWFDALADSGSTDPDTRLAALAHRARCAPDTIDDQTVPTVIGLLRQVTPASRPEPDQAARGGQESSRLCTCETEPEPDPGVPGHIAAAFDDLERHGRVHATTTPVLTAFHEALGARFDDRKVLLTEQLRSPDRATRYDTIDMTRRLLTSWRGDHTSLVRLVGDCLLPGDSHTSAAAAEALGSLAGLAEPAREALAAYVTTQLTEHRPDAWASPHRAVRRAHQQAVMTLAGLGDERALPSLLVALDTGTDAWRAVAAAAHLPQAATELVPRIISHFAAIDPATASPGFGFTSFTITLARLGDPTAIPALTDTLQAAVQHRQWHIAEPVLKALGSFGPRAAAALETVRPLTKADNVALRTGALSAAWEIERSPEEVVPLLDGLLEQHRNTDAIDLAGRIGPAAAPVLPRLRQILDEQLAQNTRNEHTGSSVLNDWWTLIRVASALWDIDGADQADTVLPVLLDAWKNNDASAHAVIACLDRMGPAARPALPQIQAALAQPHRYDQRWIGAVSLDLEIERTCRTLLVRLQDLPEAAPAGQE
ncbi:HEAT repeat domain-containing protein [Streptomyces sp. SJL17-1]|uniref:HEAT repeat domain-containing protein n=1 Tax=Streptomyces sp. SJL17-1 TaxID=2967223 RepID=UPI0029677096|nr:HEAT repeat domain-containing protein [Streptomyces sp. SJL17-1]